MPEELRSLKADVEERQMAVAMAETTLAEVARHSNVDVHAVADELASASEPGRVLTNGAHRQFIN